MWFALGVIAFVDAAVDGLGGAVDGLGGERVTVQAAPLLFFLKGHI